MLLSPDRVYFGSRKPVPTANTFGHPLQRAACHPNPQSAFGDLHLSRHLSSAGGGRKRARTAKLFLTLCKGCWRDLMGRMSFYQRAFSFPLSLKPASRS